MVNKALMLENHRGVIEHKHKLVRCISIIQVVAPDRMLLPLQLDLRSVLLSRR
jgi:hypothetical protein